MAPTSLSLDPNIRAITKMLKSKFKCHTAILYGSRSRGNPSTTSDYDIVGIRKSGPKTRIARAHKGIYWDLIVHSERELNKLGDEHRCWKTGKILFEKNDFGKKLLRKVKRLASKPAKALPKEEISLLKIWARKELERCQALDIIGAYRRAELLNAMIDHYFVIRKLEYTGPKEGFAWLKANDKKTFKALQKTLTNPINQTLLKQAAKLVYKL